MKERDWTHPLLADVGDLHMARWGMADPLPQHECEILIARVRAALAAWVPSSSEAWRRYDDAAKALAEAVLAEYEDES